MCKRIFCLLLICFLCSCRPYQPVIEQGNVLDKKIIAQLVVGMDKNRVVELLGYPVLDNLFNQDTWIYINHKQQRGQGGVNNKLVLQFKQNKLVRIN